MTTGTVSPPSQPYRFGRFLGWILFLLGWNFCAHFTPEAWLRQFDNGLVAWQVLASGVWLTGGILLLYPKPWPAWLKLLLLAAFGCLLGLGVYYKYQIQRAQEVIDAYQRSRPGH